MNDKDLALFKMKAIRSKKELIRAIDSYLVRIQESGLPAEGQVAESLELMREFKAKIEESLIPFLEKPYCAYEIMITDIEISLDMVEYKEIVFDCDGEIEEATASVISDIVCVRASYITVDEFARRRNVKSATVKRWLQQGKLHNAEKHESGWRIAATQRRPTREFVDGTFIFEGHEGDLSRVAPVPVGTILASFSKDESSSSGYIALYQSESHRVLARPEIEKEELVKIKKTFTSMPNVIFQSTFIDAITDKVFFEGCEFESVPFVLAKVEEFVDSSVLPAETKRLLKVMLLSEGDGELLLSTVRKLGLEESLRRHLQMK